MALAIKFQEMVDRGEVRDYADLARLGYVTMPSSGLCRVDLDPCSNQPGMTGVGGAEFVVGLGIVWRTVRGF
jgi:hypothetical protein